MTFGRIEVHSTSARLDFTSQSEQLSYRQPPPRLSIVRTRGSMEIETVAPKLEVDSSACRADEGIKPVSQVIEENAQEGMQSLQEMASRYTQEGRYIMENFHDSKSVQADLARQKALPPPRQLGMRFVPSEPPDIRFTDPEFHIDARPDTLEFDWDVHPSADVEEVQSASIEYRIAQYPSISFDYVPPNTLDVTA